VPLSQASLIQGRGLAGDHYARPGKRQVTLIAAEDLDRIAERLGRPAVPPDLVRRNIVIAGVDLAALGRRFRLGGALLEATGPCDPCARMDALLGEGALAAMQGLAGITARIIEGGTITLGSAATALEPEPVPVGAAGART
jgi:MOSC domain-containing protein YiiM